MNQQANTGKDQASLVDSNLQQGERKAAKQGTKAQRKADRQRDEIAQANKVMEMNVKLQEQPIDFIAILDFEATCDDQTKLDVQEIIEFPTVFVSASTGKVEFIYHTYVKPDVNPTLTKFCTELTGIEQETVENGISIQEALVSHRAFLEKHGLVSALEAAESPEEHKGKKTFVYATCGDWDLKTCLPKQLRYRGISCPAFMSSWFNLKEGFRDFYKIKPTGMAMMLMHAGLKLEGRHHSGIDDCKNLARIVQKMIKEGWELDGFTATTLR